MANLDLTMQNYHLATAEILYYMPDHPSLVQTFIWQQYDVAPNYPQLKKFLDFWTANIDATLHSVAVVSRKTLSPAEYRFAAASYRIH
ncbi:MAG: protein usg [Sphingomonadales bacterium]